VVLWEDSLSITKRIDAVTLIPDSHMRTVLPAPKSVKIELTGRCNYRCSFCALAVREKQPTKDMDLGFFKRITREMRDAGTVEIGVFFIGESFLCPELLIDAVLYLKRELEMPYVFLTSNSSLAEPRIVSALMSAGLNSLKWSVNSGSEEDFVRVMKVRKELFWKALQNIRDAWLVREHLHAKTGLYASSIQYDGEQQAKMSAFLDAHVRPYVDEHYWLPLYSMGSFATAREEALGYRPTAGNQGRIGALRSPLPCWSAFTEGHVTSAGKLSACCFDASDNWSMADLHETPFAEAWNSAAFRALRQKHLDRDVSGTACEKCAAYGG
jgi:radical SAM protein with 4Fe4S-binding SPASM domain